MKRVYENFEELADAMCKGEGILHAFNCPGAEGCLDWQKGVRNFAEWLDHIGATVQITDSAESFYDFMAREYPASVTSEQEIKQ